MRKLFNKIQRNLTEKKDTNEDQNTIYAPADGKLVLLEDVNDPVFNDGSMGLGCAVIPKNGKIYAPISGVIQAVFPTNHAIGIKNKDGIEILLHIGINTVELNGKGFSALVEKDEKVKVGQLIMEYDLDLIKENGFDTDIIVILTNSSQYKGISYEPKSIKHGEALFSIKD